MRIGRYRIEFIISQPDNKKGTQICQKVPVLTNATLLLVSTLHTLTALAFLMRWLPIEF